MSISLCMIAKNEEANIQKVIEHHKQFVSEIIVVDTGSTDNTKNVCKDLNCKVYDFEWCDDFSKARNESLKHATGDWILILDCDEFISTQDLVKINVMADINTRNVCYLFTQRHYTDNPKQLEFFPVSGKYPEFEKDSLGYYESSVVRFFPRNEDLFFTHCIHELIETQANLTNKYRLVHVPILIHHYGAKKMKSKVDFYIKLGEKKIKEEPENARAFYELGLQYNAIGATERASQMFDESYFISNTSEVASDSGFAKFNAKNYSGALQEFKESLKLNRLNYSAFVGISLVWEQLGNLNKSIFAIEQAVALAPTNVNNLRIYAKLLEKNNKPLESVHIYKRMKKLVPSLDEPRIEALRIIKQYKLYPGEWDYDETENVE